MDRLVFLILVLIRLSFGNERNFTVDVHCDERQISVKMTFNAPFQGTIFSKDFHRDPNCRYRTPISSETIRKFNISVGECGTFVNEVNKTVYISNVIIVQHDPLLQTYLDSEVTLNCELSGEMKRPTSDVHEIQEEQSRSENTSDAWLDFKLESDESSDRKVFQIGDKIIALIYVRYDGKYDDVLVKNCKARNVEDITSPIIKLLDEHGCSGSQKILTPFNFSTAPSNMNANKVGVGKLNAFRFTDSNYLSISCEIEICEVPCSGICHAEVSNFGMGLERRSLTEYDNINAHTTRNFMQYAMNAFASRLKKYHLETKTQKDSDSQPNDPSSKVFGRAAEVEELQNLDTDLPGSFVKKGSTLKPNKLFTVTRNIIVLSYTDSKNMGRKSLLKEAQYICISKVRIMLLSIFLTIVVISLLVACISMACYIKNEIKRNKISNYLLYSYR